MATTTADPGVSSTTAPYWLDAGGTITDASGVQADTLVVPVTVSPQASCGTPVAKYDFFLLASGLFPKGTFYDTNHNALTSNPQIGLGIAYSPVIAQNGNGSAIVYGSAAQNPNGKIGFQVAATSGLHVGPGLVGWQPLWMTQP
jgi:type IV pilus assembly protein PilY1